MNSTAVKAAGAIHSRFREEVHPRRSGELEDRWSIWAAMPGVREKGLLRLEGKEYIVKDGDVLVIRHG